MPSALLSASIMSSGCGRAEGLIDLGQSLQCMALAGSRLLLSCIAGISFVTVKDIKYVSWYIVTPMPTSLRPRHVIEDARSTAHLKKKHSTTPSSVRYSYRAVSLSPNFVQSTCGQGWGDHVPRMCYWVLAIMCGREEHPDGLSRELVTLQPEGSPNRYFAARGDGSGINIIQKQSVKVVSVLCSGSCPVSTFMRWGVCAAAFTDKSTPAAVRNSVRLCSRVYFSVLAARNRNTSADIRSAVQSGSESADES